MSILRKGYFLGPILGAAWMLICSITLTIFISFAIGHPLMPNLFILFLLGAFSGVIFIYNQNKLTSWLLVLVTTFILVIAGYSPITLMEYRDEAAINLLINLVTILVLGLALTLTLKNTPFSILTRYEFESCLMRFFTGFGYIFFTIIVMIPFYLMIMTSLKNQSELLLNPLDFSIDIAKGFTLFRSYFELFTEYNFGSYLWTSFFVSILTVLITLVFAIPGAYAVARLQFKGRAIFSRSILLIYMVPMIVLALPIYIGFSVLGIRNSIFGIILIYPVTTIPVALYMLQGYFRSLPTEVEEAGLMDGLSRLTVIWKITLPLSIPALVSVSLYVFMIAWNEFLIAFMLLDDPSKFTLTRGIAMLDSSEIPRQHLMAGSVIATVPILAIFLSLEKYMTKGLASGSVKG